MENCSYLRLLNSCKSSILHVKLGGCCRHSCFSTFTLSRHTSHNHDDLLEAIDFWYEKIWLTYDLGVDFWHGNILTLVWANLTSCKFPFFLFLCAFSKASVSLKIMFCRVAATFVPKVCSSISSHLKFVWHMSHWGICEVAP